jgi:hypothetical protein
VFNSLSQKENANQNYTEIPSHPSQIWPSSKRKQTANAKMDVGKRALIHCWWECKLVQPLWKLLWRLLKNLKIEFPYDPAKPLLGI